jgi:hypothetical protein
MHGAACWTVDAAAEVGPSVTHAASQGGVHLVHVRTDRQANVGLHEELHRAVRDALG